MREPTHEDWEMREPTDEDWEGIEAALGFPIDARRRERLYRTLLLALMPGRPLPQPTLRAFAILKRDAARLYFDLWPDARASMAENPKISWKHVPDEENLTETERQELVKIRAILRPETLSLLGRGLAQLIARVDSFIKVTTPPTDKSGRPGRPLDFHFRVMIIELSKIYAEWSDRNPGVWTKQGPFIRFVKACLQAFKPELMKRDAALATAIKRTLSSKTPLNYTLKVKT